MTEEEFLKQIEKYKWDNNGLVSYLKTEEAKVFSSDREFIMQVVQANGTDLKIASDDLKADREVVMAAVSHRGDALLYASEDLKADKEVVMAAVSSSRGSGALTYVSEELKADKEVVTAAVSYIGNALREASDELKADKEVVAAAIKSNGLSIQFASSKLQSDVDLICDAFTQSSDSLKYVNQNILSTEAFKKKFHSIISKMDRKRLMRDLSNNVELIEYIPDNQKNDKELILGCSFGLGLALRFVSDDLKNDKEIVLKALKKDGLALKYASNILKNDKDVVLNAIQGGYDNLDEKGMAIQFASSDLRSDVDIIALAYQINKKTKQFVSPETYESSEFKEALDRISLMEDDQIEFTVIAGEDEQYSKTLYGSAQELSIIGFPLYKINVLGEEQKFEDFQSDACDDFIISYGSYDEFWSQSYSKIKVIRNNKVIFDTNNLN